MRHLSNHHLAKASLFLVLLAATTASAALQPPAHLLIDGDAVHEVYLAFDQPDWWQQLTDNFENHDDPPYLEASFACGPYQLATIGVRFKGNSS